MIEWIIPVGGVTLVALTIYFTTMHNTVKHIEDQIENMHMNLPSPEEVAKELTKIMKIPISSLSPEMAAKIKSQMGGVGSLSDGAVAPVKRKSKQDPVKLYTG